MCLCFSSHEERAKALKRPLKFTETTPLSRKFQLILIRAGSRKTLRLVTPDISENVADISSIANQSAEIAISGTTFYIHRPEPCLYAWRTQGAFDCEIKQVCCRVEFQFVCEDKEYRLLMLACLKNKYAVFAVEQDRGVAKLRKVVDISKVSKWSERFELACAEELSLELVACFAYFLILSRSSDM